MKVPLRRRIVVALVGCAMLFVLGGIIALGTLDGIIASMGRYGSNPVMVFYPSRAGLAATIAAIPLAALCFVTVLIHSKEGPLSTLLIPPVLQIGAVAIMVLLVPYLPYREATGFWSTELEAQIWAWSAILTQAALALAVIAMTFWAVFTAKKIVLAVPCPGSDDYSEEQGAEGAAGTLRVFCPFCSGAVVVPKAPGTTCKCPLCRWDFVVPRL
jgi:hypothetical protein